MTDFSDADLTVDQGQTLAESLAYIGLELQALTKRATELGAQRLSKPPPITQMLKDMVDLATPEGTGMVHLWRTGSASAHGHYWADDMRDTPAAFNHEWFQPAIQGAMLMISKAMTLRQERTGSRGS